MNERFATRNAIGLGAFLLGIATATDGHSWPKALCVVLGVLLLTYGWRPTDG